MTIIVLLSPVILWLLSRPSDLTGKARRSAILIEDFQNILETVPATGFYNMDLDVTFLAEGHAIVEWAHAYPTHGKLNLKKYDKKFHCLNYYRGVMFDPSNHNFNATYLRLPLLNFSPLCILTTL